MGVHKKFSEFEELSDSIKKTLALNNFVEATPVQESCIPLFLGNKDVIVEACTGSGKTLAFVIPIIERILRLPSKLSKYQVGAIIVSPTRELAKQIAAVCQLFVTSCWITTILVTGGKNGGHVVVATPGRLLDVLENNMSINTKSLEILVLDEADRLLDLGFQRQLNHIFKKLPRQRRTGLFSATQTEALEDLARAGLRNPVKIKVSYDNKANNCKSEFVAGQKTPQSLDITYFECTSSEKVCYLIQFLQEHTNNKIAVFFLTCAMVELYYTIFSQLGLDQTMNIKALHGRLKQKQRQLVFDNFSKENTGCLFCTDVASRGLDVPDIDWIIQLDPPQNPDALVHRVGRTARMGRSGNALLFLLPNETAYVEFLRRRKIPLNETELFSGLNLNSLNLINSMRHMAEADRDILEKGIRAFVSYVRGYKEHQCKFIFKFSELDLAQVAYACALLSLPKMPEMKKVQGKLKGFNPSEVDLSTIKFKDKARQLAFEKKMEAKIKVNNTELPQKGKVTKTKEKRVPAAKRRILEQRQDLQDFTEDYRLLKRVKKGKMSEGEYNKIVNMLDD